MRSLAGLLVLFLLFSWLLGLDWLVLTGVGASWLALVGVGLVILAILAAIFE